MSDEKSPPVVPTPEPSQEDSGAPSLAVTPPEPAPAEERPVSEAYLSIMRSTARSVEETGEHLRQLAALSTAASGVALRMLLSGEQSHRSVQTLAQAQQCLQEATALFQRLGQVSNQFLERLQPRPSAPPVGDGEDKDTSAEAHSRTEREPVS